MIEFALPDVGEGLTEAEVIAWHVAVGDAVDVNDIIAEIETAKSVVELPCPAAGVIAELHVDVGVTVGVGTVLVSIRPGAHIVTDLAAEEPNGLGDTSLVDAAADDSPLVLVGTGPTIAAARRRHLRPRSVARESASPVRGVPKVTAAAVAGSAFPDPHVTAWLTVDVTSTMDMIRRLRQDRNWAETRVTFFVFVAKALLLAIRRFPDINARWDENAQEVVLHHFVNLGVRVATPRGLTVPNIKDADRLGLTGLADAIDSLVESTRSGKTSPEEMSNGTIIVTDVGALGVDAGTSILNPGESAVLALGAVRVMPWVVDGQIVPREVTQLAMSFDHRLIDGALGSHVLAEVGRLLSDPRETFLYV